MRLLSRIHRIGDINQEIAKLLGNGNVINARKLFDQYPLWINAVSWNSLINRYSKNGDVMEAQFLFEQMPHRNVVSWNTMLSGFRDLASTHKMYCYFVRMIAQGYRPDEVTLSLLVSSFLHTEFDVLIPQLHCLVISSGLSVNANLGSTLMRGYVGLGNLGCFIKVFDEIAVKDVVQWNTLILGYMKFGMTRAARRAFDVMPGKDAFSWCILIDGYMKNKQFHEAKAVFDSQGQKDVVSWTTMVRGCMDCGNFVEALHFFVLMMKSDVRPNHFTFSSALDACAGSSYLVFGNQVHACLWKFGIPRDVVLATSLVDMYGKCGDIHSAFSIFQSMSTKNLVSWNSIIGGYARHGLASRALMEFKEMLRSGLKPDEISFINVLSACVHGGLVEEGEQIFYSMGAKHGIRAEIEHYTCMVDLYGRAGQLEKAEKLIKGMPFEADVVVWGTLLVACGLHSRLELGKSVANRISMLERDHPAVYSMLSRLYCENGSCSGVIPPATLLQKWRLRKQKAGSWT